MIAEVIPLTAVIINTCTVALGSFVGLLCRRGIPMILFAVGLCSVIIGVRGAVESTNSLVLVLSLVSGAAVGSALDIQGMLNRFGKVFESQEGEL